MNKKKKKKKKKKKVLKTQIILVPHCSFRTYIRSTSQYDGEFSEPFEVTNGVKQGCVLAPTLFSMMFSAMLMDAFQDSDTGFPIRYHIQPQKVASQN